MLALTELDGLVLPLGLVDADGETDGLTDDDSPPAPGLWSTMTHSAATRAAPPGAAETRTPAVAASSVAFVQADAVPGCW